MGILIKISCIWKGLYSSKYKKACWAVYSIGVKFYGWYASDGVFYANTMPCSSSKI